MVSVSFILLSDVQLRVNSGQLRGKFTCGDQSESSDEEVEVTTLPRDLVRIRWYSSALLNVVFN